MILKDENILRKLCRITNAPIVSVNIMRDEPLRQMIVKESKMAKYYESVEIIERMRLNSPDNGRYVPKFLSRWFSKERTRKMKLVTAWEHCLRYISRDPISLAVISTAVIYLKRFYIENSTKNYDIEVIAPTCLFMALNLDAKTPVQLDSFASRLRLSRKQRAKFESAVECDSLVGQITKKLQFQLTVKHPFDSVHHFMSEIKAKLCSDLNDLRPSIDKFLQRVYHSDVVLVYLPAQIALAAMVDAAHAFDIPHVDHYIRYILPKDLQNWEDGITNKIDVVIADIRRMVHAVTEPWFLFATCFNVDASCN